MNGLNEKKTDRYRFFREAAPLWFLFALLWLLTHVTYDPLKREWLFSEPQVLRGDEPHYLLLVNSLLFDHDLNLRDDYMRVKKGGLQAGWRFRDYTFDHQTVLFDPATGDKGFWGSVFETRKRVSCDGRDELCQGFARKSPRFLDMGGVREFGMHHPGYPALAAAFISLTRPSLGEVERRVFYF